MAKIVSEIPYTSVTTAMEDNSTRGSNSLNTFPRKIRGLDDNVLIEYDESNRSTYSSFNFFNKKHSIFELSSSPSYSNDLLDPIKRIALNSDHIKFKGGDHEIVDVEIEDGGSGYSDGTLTAEVFGTNFLANYIVDSNGAIESIDIIHHGAGYTDEPPITISDTNGSNASLKPILGLIIGSNNYVNNDDSCTAFLNLHLKSNSIGNALIKSNAGIDATKLHDGSVTNTEFGYINTLSSNAQTQLDSKLPLSGGTITGDLNLDNDVKVIYGDAGEYISGDGTDLSIVSSGDITLSATGGDYVLTNSGTQVPRLTLKNTADQYGTPSVIAFEINPSNNVGTDGDDIGRIDFKSDDDSGNVTTYAQILGEISDSFNPNEDGKLSFKCNLGGTMTTLMSLANSSNANVSDITIGASTDSSIKLNGSTSFLGNSLTFQSNTITSFHQLKKWHIQTGGYRLNNNSSTNYYFQYRPNSDNWSNYDSSIGTISSTDIQASMLNAPYDGKVTKISITGYTIDTGATDPFKFYVFKGTATNNASSMSLTEIACSSVITPSAPYRIFLDNTDITSNNTFSENDFLYVMYKKESTSANQDIYFSVTVSGEYTS